VTPAPHRPEWVWNPNDETPDDGADGPDTDGGEDTEGDEDGGAS
jgi:hypothetical protein